MLHYGLKQYYEITPNTEAADFIQKEVQNYFNYTQKSKRQKYADIWISPSEGINVKTDNLCSVQNKGRLCTAEVNLWLRNKNNNLKFLFVEYSNNNGNIIIESTTEYYIEEIVYEICNQGRGLLQPKRYNNKLIIRDKIPRDEWIKEFKHKYSQFIDTQISRFEKYKLSWCY